MHARGFVVAPGGEIAAAGEIAVVSDEEYVVVLVYYSDVAAVVVVTDLIVVGMIVATCSVVVGVIVVASYFGKVYLNGLFDLVVVMDLIGVEGAVDVTMVAEKMEGVGR